MRTRHLAAILSLVLSLTLSLAGCDQKEGQAETGGAENKAPAGRVVKVEVMEIQPTSIRDVLVLPGETKPWQDVTLSADQAGNVEWIGPQEGDRVKQGDLLAKIDVSALKAALDNAQAAFKLADDLYKRRLRLYQEKIISREELEQVKTDRTVKLGALRQVKVQYEHGFVHAPIDGVVNFLHVDPGEFVGQGAPILDLVKVDRIKIDVFVPELDVRYLSKGHHVLVRVDAFQDENIIGQIDFVSFKADPATKSFRVTVAIDNTDLKIRPGMIARVFFQKRIIPDALAVPLFALVDKGGERLVFVEKDGVAQARVVEIGVIERDRVQITKGLKPGDKLIVTGQTEVEEGTRVIVQ